MIKKLSGKLTIIISLSLSSILIILLIILNVASIKSRSEQSRSNLQSVANYLLNNNLFPDSNDTETANTIIGSNDFYIVVINSLGNMRLIQNNPNGNYTKTDILKYTTNILEENSTKGRINHLLYQVISTNNLEIIILMDNIYTDTSIGRFLIFSLLFSVVGIISIIIMASYLSKWLIKPIEENFQKQKDFISDASHELKTPLTIISANCDLLEEDVGSNKWLTYIKTETTKMTTLIQELLTLSKTENPSNPIMQEENLSDLVTSSVMSIESLAYENNITLISNIQPNLYLICYAPHIKELVTILLDNAIKYSEPLVGERNIKVELITTKSHYIINVSNTGNPISKEDRDKIFERFYRIDKSHNRKDGHYGLGLAIAKSIVTSHHGTINVDCKGGWTTFTVNLPK